MREDARPTRRRRPSRMRWFAATVLAAAPVATMAGPVFKCTAANGTIVFSDRQCGPDAKLQSGGSAEVARKLEAPTPGGGGAGSGGGSTSAPRSLTTYLADARLLSGRQSSAKAPIQYSDGADGMLLKSVLDPGRVRGVLSEVIGRGDLMLDHECFTQLADALKPVTERYERAFHASAPRYEPEYLDSVELTVAVILGVKDLARSLEDATPRRGGAKKAIPAGGATGPMDALMKTAARSLQDEISRGKFTPAGAARATAIVNSLH